MSSYTQEELDERAFAIFLRQGILYFLDQDSVLRQGTMIEYSHRLYQTWLQMQSGEKTAYIRRAREDLEKLRGRATEAFQYAMRQVTPSA